MKGFFKKIGGTLSSFFGRFSRRTYTTIAAVLICSILVVDVGYHLFRSLSSEVETMPAKVSSLSETLVSDAYLVYDETPLPVSAKRVVYYVGEGDKVAAGTPLAAVYPDSVSADSVSRLTVGYQALRLLREVKGERTDKVSDTLETQIAGVTLAISQAVEDGDLRLAAAYRNELEALSLCREKLLGTVDPEAAYALVQGETALLEASLGTPLSVIKADSAGWFSSSCDSYTAQATASSLTEKSYEELTALLEAADSESHDAIGRIINTYRWYAVTAVKSEEARLLARGKTYSVSLGHKTLSMTLEKTVFRGNDEDVFLLFSCASPSEGLALDRVSPLSLELSRYEGFKIPTGALAYNEGVEGVYIQRGFVVEFREISVIYRDDNMLIAEEKPTQSSELFRDLAENDNIIVKGEDLYEGKIIG